MVGCVVVTDFRRKEEKGCRETRQEREHEAATRCKRHTQYSHNNAPYPNTMTFSQTPNDIQQFSSSKHCTLHRSVYVRPPPLKRTIMHITLHTRVFKALPGQFLGLAIF